VLSLSRNPSGWRHQVAAFIGRREFITLLGGAAAAWPLCARAQPGPLRRIGVLVPLGADDPEAQARIAAFSQTLKQLGWIEGRYNLRIDIRWGAGDADRLRKDAMELAALEPNVILANGSAAVAHRADRFRCRDRPGRRWFCRDYGAAGRQRDWVY
jgi:hypothetical protein